MAITNGSTADASDFGISGGSTTKDLSVAGATTIAHGLGKTPKLVHIMAMYASGGGSSVEDIAYGIYVGGAAYAVSKNVQDNVSGGGSATLYGTFTLEGITGTITCDATNITITWSGTVGATVRIVWDAQLGA